MLLDRIINCKECGRIFQSNGLSKICPTCQRTDEENFKKVKEYIYDNPGATMIDIVQETGVSEEKVLRYLREGRLEISGGENALLFLQCERCGKGIRTGRFCDECSREMEKDLRGAYGLKSDSYSKKKEKTKMYIAEIRREIKNKR
ncbi:MAG TPA: MerR family transcriptional regulator [Clostridiales bacterium]|nr:MerR family transcriptional regulator [Clostridiales bacterium]